MTSALMAAAFAGTALAAAASFDATSFFGPVTLQDLGQALGLGALVFLFATDRILTKGQHERRVADIVGGHDKLIAIVSERLGEVTTSRNYYREALQEEKTRADALAKHLAELGVEASQAAATTMTALEEAAREVSAHDA